MYSESSWHHRLHDSPCECCYPHASSRKLGNKPKSTFNPSQSLYLRYLGYPQTSYHRLRGADSYGYSPLATLITPETNGQPTAHLPKNISQGLPTKDFLQATDCLFGTKATCLRLFS